VWLADPWVTVSVGQLHDCFIDGAGVTYCQGDNDFGQLGKGITGSLDSVTALMPVAGGLKFDSLTTGRWHTCGLAASRAYCWGYDAQGGLGLGVFQEPNRPTPVAGNLVFAALDAGSLYTCGLTTDAAAYCWGDNREGTLGDGTRTLQLGPVPVAGGLRFRSISTGPDHACGIAIDGGLYCWGANRSGQLGDGSTSDALVPIKAAHQR
jgi:alpha-tubulin suppressor-like RCC1 family protein